MKPEDIEIGQLVNAEPANLQELEGAEFQIEKAKAAVIVVRMDPNTITIPPSRGLADRRHPLLFQDLHPRGLPDQPVGAADPPPAVPVSPVDFRPRKLGSGGLRPAKRALPQLPITTDAEGYIIAQRDFPSRLDRAILNGTRVMISKKAITDG